MSDKNPIKTVVSGRTLSLTNLEKILYPSIGVTKAEVIEYYLSVSEYLLTYVRGRPLTTIRFPDGIEKSSFYSKDAPGWRPAWVDTHTIQHDESIINYILPEDTATLVWLANLACLEWHPMQFRKSDDECPDIFIVDLDPDEGVSFDSVKTAAQRMNDFLKTFDYTPFVKTSGGKGLHLVVPIVPDTHYSEVSRIIKTTAKEFVKMYPQDYTLSVSKAQRKGKILIDIYRNHLTNTTVSPYSLRGRKGAPVSTPLTWGEVPELRSAYQFSIANILPRLQKVGDIWAEMSDFAVHIYDREKSGVAGAAEILLGEYVEKRNFSKTSEPIARIARKKSNRYVIQLHDASSLHYDLRLEQNGVLASWAIPKGLPYKNGDKRLAIQTENHPVGYLFFEGSIPKGEYGAGEMKIIESGTVKWKENEENSLEFTLESGLHSRKYRLYKISSENQWLIECINTKVDFYNVKNQAKPMLAGVVKEVPTNGKYSYEVKWDGIRVLLYYEDNTVTIMSRGGRDITDRFPELVDFPCKIEQGVYDGEIVVLDPEGKPRFHDVISRLHTSGKSSIRAKASSMPTTCYLFDVISMDGKNISHLGVEDRQRLLKMTLEWNATYRISDSFGDGKLLFEAALKKGLEGIMAKKIGSAYYPGEKSDVWLKVKARKEAAPFIIGYTVGKGDRNGLIGALHLATLDRRGVLVYRGKVGTGFDLETLMELSKRIQKIPASPKLVSASIDEASKTTWVEPIIKCEIEYASLTNNGTFREPVFRKIIES